MDYSKRIKLNGILLNKENILKLLEILDRHFKSYNMDFDLSDDNSIKSLSKEEFLNFDFTNETIKSIEINGHNEKNNKFSLKKDWLDKYYIDFTAVDKDELSVIKGELEDWIRKSNYLKQTKRFFNSILFAVIVFVLCIIPEMILLWNYQQYTKAIAFSSALLLIPIFMLVLWVFRKMFPRVEIDIGNNIHKQLRKYGWLVLSLIIIPMIIAIVL